MLGERGAYIFCYATHHTVDASVQGDSASQCDLVQSPALLPVKGATVAAMFAMVGQRNSDPQGRKSSRWVGSRYPTCRGDHEPPYTHVCMCVGGECPLTLSRVTGYSGECRQWVHAPLYSFEYRLL